MDVQPHLLNLSAYINQNLEKDLPLSALARRVGLSPFHFHRKFGAYFGESLHQHIKRLRLERAAFALTHGGQPVRQIARESGYKTVSAFSHAFSGFAGESPTRYRSLGAQGGLDRHAHDAEVLEPAWIGHVESQEFAFVRATGHSSGDQPEVRAAIALIQSRLRGAAGPEGASRSASMSTEPDDEHPLEFIVATSDVYGVSKQKEFRVDVGIDAHRVPPDRAGQLGSQTLPGGRYARFDLQCKETDVMAETRKLSFSALRDRGEVWRLGQYFVRFERSAQDSAAEPRNYRLFIPLLG